MKGKIVKLISNDYTVKTLDEEFVCKARGKFRNMGLSPIVGDEVIFDENNKYILEVLPRNNELTRPTVANVDIAVIITSLKKPDFSSNLLDKFLVICEYNKIKPVIVFTKADLLDGNEFEDIKFDNCRVIHNKEINRIQFLFNEIPNENIRRELKSNGFHWSSVKVNIKLIKKYKIELIKNFNIVFPENAKVQLHFLELLYFLFSTSSNLSFKR